MTLKPSRGTAWLLAAFCFLNPDCSDIRVAAAVFYVACHISHYINMLLKLLRCLPVKCEKVSDFHVVAASVSSRIQK